MPRKVAPKRIAKLQRRYLREEGATPEEIRRYQPILTAQIGAESDFTQGVGSPAGAQDIAQFMPETAPGYGVKLGDGKITDDIRGQVRYMLPLLRQHGAEGALRGYNAGIGAIERSKGFSETNEYVKRVLGSADEYGGMGGAPGGPGASPQYRTIPGVDNSQGRQQAMLSYLDERGKPTALLELRSALDGSQDVPAQKVRVAGPSRNQVARPNAADDIRAEADLIDAASVPYLWGGGHQKKLIRGTKVTPMDCSGAVSRVLGIDPRVSGQFESWGKPGKGKRVTIYADEGHVLMEVDGKFWGTSQSNPGGGAGWIPRSKVSKEYLSRFTARHPRGM